MRITANSGTALDTAFLARRSVYQKNDEAPSGGTSLTVRPVTTASSTEATARPLAAFLAQLIAKAQDLPVSRERRRANPAEGAGIYRAMADLGRPNPSQNIRAV